MTGAPIHLRIAERLRARIVSGDWPPGSQLPPERALAAQQRVSRMTLRQALAALQLEGLIVRRIGRAGGTFVAEELPEVELASMSGFLGQLSARGHAVSSQVVAAERTAAEASVAAGLELPAGAPVVRIHRLRLADETPVLVEESYFPAEPLPGLLGHDLTGSLYGLLDAHYGLAPVSKAETLATAVVTAEESKLLQIGAAQTVLRIRRSARAATGQPVEFSIDTLRTDRLRITVSTPAQPASCGPHRP